VQRRARGVGVRTTSQRGSTNGVAVSHPPMSTRPRLSLYLSFSLSLPLCLPRALAPRPSLSLARNRGLEASLARPLEAPRRRRRSPRLLHTSVIAPPRASLDRRARVSLSRALSHSLSLSLSLSPSHSLSLSIYHFTSLSRLLIHSLAHSLSLNTSMILSR
jgi:hypothetical protein